MESSESAMLYESLKKKVLCVDKVDHKSLLKSGKLNRYRLAKMHENKLANLVSETRQEEMFLFR